MRAFLSLACSARASRSALAACRFSCFEVNYGDREVCVSEGDFRELSHDTVCNAGRLGKNAVCSVELPSVIKGTRREEYYLEIKECLLKAGHFCVIVALLNLYKY